MLPMTGSPDTAARFTVDDTCLPPQSGTECRHADPFFGQFTADAVDGARLRISADLDLTTGLDFADDEHADIVEIFTELTVLVSLGDQSVRSAHVGDALIDRLEAALVAHFAHEERAMIDTHYPGRVEHTGQHQAFLALLRQGRDLLARDDCDEPAVLRWLTRHLKYWFVRHTLEADKALAVWVATCEAAAARDGEGPQAADAG